MNAKRGQVAGLPVWDRCAVMGVVNVTPDSFSDGGRWFDPESAVKHGLDLAAEGADLVDVGGESTRPGAPRVDEAEELRRVLPVVRGLAAENVLVSVDTMRAAVAERAWEAGAVLVNDVSGGQADPAMIPAVAAAKAPFVVMHWRGQSIDMNNRAQYGDVTAEVITELRASLERAVAGGVDAERIVADPGLGFAKQARHDLRLVAELSRLGEELGHPLLVAASRKRFLGRVLTETDGAPPPPARERDAASAAVTALAAREGAWAVRVHEVRASADAVRVVRAVEKAANETSTADAASAGNTGGAGSPGSSENAESAVSAEGTGSTTGTASTSSPGAAAGTYSPADAPAARARTADEDGGRG